MLPDIPEGEKFPPRVVENAVYYNPDTVFMALRDKFRKFRICLLYTSDAADEL